MVSARWRPKVEEDEIHDLVEAVTGHEDVQALLTETQNAYRQAVQSDATA